MKKFILTALLFVLMSFSQAVNASTLIPAGSDFQYANLGNVNWSTLNYNTIDWNNLSWQQGQAPFGNLNISGSTVKTYWSANTDIALQKEFNVNGNVSNAVLNVAVDNGAAIYLNGSEIFKENAEGFTSYWEYTTSVNSSLFVNGSNLLQIVAEDHGGATAFDMALNADVTPVPEPATAFLGLIGAAGLLRIRKKK